MNISIFGMGYVGAVCSACLASLGHHVVGVDVSETKVDLINSGKSPIVEPGLSELMALGVQEKRIVATMKVSEAVRDTSMSMICVGTPSHNNGNLDLSHIQTVCEQIGAELKKKDDWHLVVIRSTVVPGTVRGLVIPALESTSGKKVGVDFAVAVNPEFLREGSAIEDFNAPPLTLIGEYDTRSGDVLADLYQAIDAPVLRKSIEVAEMVKCTSNVWHAVKVSFANEVGSVAQALGVDGRDVMNVICQDKKLNISETYLRPGFAFGGSCLPKDVRGLAYQAKRLDLSTPLLSSIMLSNAEQVRRGFSLITSLGRQKIGFLGLAFKEGTDDLRESPLVELVEMLIGKGYDVSIFDRNVSYARLHGANRDYIDHKIPHISALLHAELETVVERSDVLVLGTPDREFRWVAEQGGSAKQVVDLVGSGARKGTELNRGLSW